MIFDFTIDLRSQQELPLGFGDEESNARASALQGDPANEEDRNDEVPEIKSVANRKISLRSTALVNGLTVVSW